MVTAATGALEILFETLANAQQTVEQINQACVVKGLPPAFSLDENGKPIIPSNVAYRFEGFGIIVLPPQLSF